MKLRFTSLLLTLALAGCVGLVIEHRTVGQVNPVHQARRLEEGRTTIAEALAKLGPPDVILRARDVDRAYYTSWNSDYFRFVFKAEVPVVGRTSSYDFFVLTWGAEQIYLARLDFDREGILRERHVIQFSTDRSGEYAGIDSTVVSNFLEDRNRALGVEQEPDDDDEEEERGRTQ